MEKPWDWRDLYLAPAYFFFGLAGLLLSAVYGLAVLTLALWLAIQFIKLLI